MTTIDISISGARMAPNHQPFPAPFVLVQAERRCRDKCGHRLGSPWAVETVFWASPRLRPLGRRIVDGVPVSELFRRPGAKPGWAAHRNADVGDQAGGRMDGLTRLGHTQRAMARADTPPPLDHAGYRPLPDATLTRIRAGIHRYENSVTSPYGEGYPVGQPSRSPDLYPVMLAALIEMFERDQD